MSVTHETVRRWCRKFGQSFASGLRRRRPRLGEIGVDLTVSGDPPDSELLAHVSPLSWEHINLTGEYRWNL